MLLVWYDVGNLTARHASRVILKDSGGVVAQARALRGGRRPFGNYSSHIRMVYYKRRNYNRMISDFFSTKRRDIEIISCALYMSSIIEAAMLFALKMQNGCSFATDNEIWSKARRRTSQRRESNILGTTSVKRVQISYPELFSTYI